MHQMMSKTFLLQLPPSQRLQHPDSLNVQNPKEKPVMKNLNKKKEERNPKFRNRPNKRQVLRIMNDDDEIFYWLGITIFIGSEVLQHQVDQYFQALQLLQMGNMGTECMKIIQKSKIKQDRMLACLRLMKKVFISQLITSALEGIFLGYYLTNSFLIFKKEFEAQEFISPLCEICSTNNFQLICRDCRKILCCQECFDKKKIQECSSCGCSLKKQKIIKIFMN